MMARFCTSTCAGTRPRVRLDALRESPRVARRELESRRERRAESIPREREDRLFGALGRLDESHRVDLAAEVSIDAPDFGQLEPMLDQALAHLRRNGITEQPDAFVGDAGYWHTARSTRSKEKGQDRARPHPLRRPTQDHDRAGRRTDQMQPARRPTHAKRQSRRTVVGRVSAETPANQDVPRRNFPTAWRLSTSAREEVGPARSPRRRDQRVSLIRRRRFPRVRGPLVHLAPYPPVRHRAVAQTPDRDRIKLSRSQARAPQSRGLVCWCHGSGQSRLRVRRAECRRHPARLLARSCASSTPEPAIRRRPLPRDQRL